MWKITFSFLIFFLLFTNMPVSAREPIRYVALGDSYTIGTGAWPEESWPAVVTKRLRSKRIKIELTNNLGRIGWTTRDVIKGELPVFEQIKPTAATLLIGSNDWVQGVDVQTFRANFHEILTRVLNVLPNKSLLIITIPDFSGTPVGFQYAGGRDIAKGLSEFNQIIVEEAGAFGLKVVDLFPFSQEMVKQEEMISKDGLHPSAKGYAKWADIIAPAFEKMLKSNK